MGGKVVFGVTVIYHDGARGQSHCGKLFHEPGSPRHPRTTNYLFPNRLGPLRRLRALVDWIGPRLVLSPQAVAEGLVDLVLHGLLWTDQKFYSFLLKIVGWTVIIETRNWFIADVVSHALLAHAA